MEPGLIRGLKERKGARCYWHWSLEEQVHKEKLPRITKVFLFLSEPVRVVAKLTSLLWSDCGQDQNLRAPLSSSQPPPAPSTFFPFN